MSAIGLVVLAGLGAAALLGGGRGRSGTRDTCAATPATASRWGRDRLREWVDCTTRTAAQVDACVAALRARRSSAATANADYVERRWRARRAEEDAPPDGRMTSSQAAAARSATDAPTPPATVPAAPAGHATSTAPQGRRPGTPAPTTSSTSSTSSTSTGSRRGWTVDTVSDGSGAPDPDAARTLVSRLVPRLRERRNYHNLLREFQRAAGLRDDGIYGGLSENALRYYGGDPPAAFHAPRASAPEANYVDRVIAPPSGTSEGEPLHVEPVTPTAPAPGAFILGRDAEMVSGAPLHVEEVGSYGPPFGVPEPFPAAVADRAIIGGYGGAAANPEVPSYNGEG